jgi:Kef-type K+ transport systems, membrane components
VASGVGAEVLIEPIVYLGMAGLVVPLARRLGLNEILTFLLLGVIIGPGALGQLEILQPYLLTNTEQIALLADLGVIFFDVHYWAGTFPNKTLRHAPPDRGGRWSADRYHRHFADHGDDGIWVQ